jgi:adenylate cyclase
MAKEIERKFLVNVEKFVNETVVKSIEILQGYIPRDNNVVVRIRLNKWDGNEKALLTIKGPNQGISRDEFEYEIPFKDGLEMIDKFCVTGNEEIVISKIRHYVEYEGNTWEVDFFRGDNKGLVIAEIELDSENATFKKPIWVMSEVTGQPKYYNNNLMNNPYNTWK